MSATVFNKSVFITGANRGLGRGFVDYFIQSGLKVFAGTREMSDKDTNTDQLVWVKVDVRDDRSIEEAVKSISETSSSVDFLINCAGVNKDSATNNQRAKVCSIKDLDREAMLAMFDVNSVSPLLVTQKFLPILKGDPSFVINISSCRASYYDEFGNSSPNYGYRASKTALNMLTYCSATDLPSNVQTFAVHPGSVKTDMNPSGGDLPIKQAEKIIDITRNWKKELNGMFLRYSGELYPH